MTLHRRQAWLVGLILVELLGAALVLRWLFSPAPGAPSPRVAATAVAEPTSSPPAAPVTPRTVSLPAALAPDLRQAIDNWAASGVYSSMAGSAEPDLHVEWRQSLDARPISEWVLVPVCAFPSLRRDVSEGDLRDAWLGRGSAGTGLARLVVTAEVASALDGLWGSPDSNGRLTVVTPGEIVDRVWQRGVAGDYDTLAIVPFHQLEPQLSPLTVDGASALDPSLDLADYPLVARLWATGKSSDTAALVAALDEAGLSTNRQPERLTELILTGVTALTRHVAVQIEAIGDPAWPARGVADLLASADVTHVSNEVSFLSDCQADPETTAFCARPEYLDTLRLAGVDIVELTGNHNLDLGAAPALASLDLYAAAGMYVFGGGEDEAAARRPLVVENKGNRVAFLGYNAFGPHYAWAGPSSPGAARFSIGAVAADVAQVSPYAGLVLVTVQYTETYDTVPLPRQVVDLRAVLDAGADVVVGTQAHQPQAIEFYDGKLIFYGLGNLFFDQTWSAATCQSLIVRLMVYDSRLLAAEIIPTSMSADYQPYVAPPRERDAILQEVFQASGW